MYLVTIRVFLVSQDLNLIDPQRIKDLEDMIEDSDQRFVEDLGMCGIHTVD